MKKACVFCPQFAICAIRLHARVFQAKSHYPQRIWLHNKKTASFRCFLPIIFKGQKREYEIGIPVFQIQKERYESM